MSEEKVLYEGKPSKKLFLAWLLSPRVLGIIILALGIATIYYSLMVAKTFYEIASKGPKEVLHGQEYSYDNPFYVGAFCFAIAFLLYLTYLYFLMRTYQYRITSKGIYFSGGIFIRKSKFVPFYKVTNIEITQTIVERAFGIATINIQTAGMGMHIPEIRFEGLEDVEKPYGIIKEAMGKLQKQAKLHSE